MVSQNSLRSFNFLYCARRARVKIKHGASQMHAAWSIVPLGERPVLSRDELCQAPETAMRVSVLATPFTLRRATTVVVSASWSAVSTYAMQSVGPAKR